MFDWANSAYSLVITSAVFPIFYEAVTSKKDATGEIVEDFIMDKYGIRNTTMYSLAISLGFLIVAILAPILSGIADYSNSKKVLMKIFTWIGGLSCMGLYFFSLDNVMFGLWMVVLACIGYSGSIVFYDAYLPEIAEPKDHDKISANGYSMGYIGSVLLLVFCLAMITSPATFGLSDASMGPKISFVLVGLWWIGFSQITFRTLVKEPNMNRVPREILGSGYARLRKVWQEVQTIPVIKWYLTAYFFFNMGVLTVMYMAANFAAKEIKIINEDGTESPLETMQLIMTILIIQVVAIAGAFLFSFLSKKLGNIKALMIAIVIWIGICITGYFVVYSTSFFIMAGVVGLVMGGIQALSRSTYSKLLPDTVDHASYFSFFEICQFLGVIFGTASFGLIFQVTNNLRDSILAVGVYFVIGIILLTRVSSKINETGEKSKIHR